MARQYNQTELRDTVGALWQSGVPVVEIHRRLRAGSAGMKCGSIGIGKRTVYEYLNRWREQPENRPADHETDAQATMDSIEALEDRAVKLLGREIAKLERKRSITKQEIDKLNAAHRAMVSMRNRSRLTRSKPSPKGRKNGDGQDGKSALEKLAEEMRAEGERS